jgi:hypothetical protein
MSLAWDLIKETIDLVGDAHKEDAKKQARRELAVQLWGSILFEMRANCEQVRWLAERESLFAPGEGIRWGGVLHFDVSDALMPDFCKTVPAPALLARLQDVLSCLKQVDFSLRAANSAPAIAKPDERTRTVYADPDFDKHQLVLSFAKKFRDDGLIEKYNELVRTAAQIGAEFYGKRWMTVVGEIIPSELSPSNPR